MRIPVFATMAALLALAEAAPAPTSPKDANNPLVERASEDYCGTSSFINQSSGGSPTVSDCRRIATNIAGGGTWIFWDKRQLVQYGTCAFGIMSKPQRTTIVGNQDIIDLINDSINKFQWRGLVGAKGTMPCRSGSVDWGLSHTKDIG